MFVEGCYLHTAIVMTYSTDKLRKWVFLFIGWCKCLVDLKWCCMVLSIKVMRTRAARQVTGKGGNGDGNFPSTSSTKYIWLRVAGSFRKEQKRMNSNLAGKQETLFNPFHKFRAQLKFVEDAEIQIQLNLQSSCNLGNKHSSNTHLQILSIKLYRKPYKLEENEMGPELPVNEPKCSGNIYRKIIICIYVVNNFINFSY